MPLELFKHRTLATANGVAALLAAAMFSWFFLSALYLQLVLGYSPLDVGLAFLPATILMGAFSLGLSAKVVMRFGIRTPLVAGLALLAAACSGSRARRSTGRTSTDVLPSMILLALGAGLAFNPLLLAAMGDVAPEQSGLASGLVNTTQMMGGALGLADPRQPRRVAHGRPGRPRRPDRRLPRGVPRGSRVRDRRPRPGRGADGGEDARDGRRARHGSAGRGRRRRRARLAAWPRCCSRMPEPRAPS